METLAPSISDLITSLKSAFHHSDHLSAERILFSWAESLKAELSQTLSDELLVLGVEKAELGFRVLQLEKELDLVKKENVSLLEKLSTVSESMEEFKKKVEFGSLELRVLNLDNEIELVKKESISLKEKVTALSKIAEESQRQSCCEEKQGRGEDCFANKTPVKRSFRAVCSDSQSSGDDNLPIGEVFNIRRVEGDNKVVENTGSRKRRLIRVGEIEGPVMENCTVGDEPGPEARGSGSTGFDEKCTIEDLEDCKGSDMHESDSSGSSVARKVGTRKRTRKLNYSDTEEEQDDKAGSESGYQVNGSKHARSRHAKVIREKMNINLDYPGSEEDPDTESDSEGDSLGGFIVSGSEPESDDSKSSFSEEETCSEDDATLGDLLKNIKREKESSGKKWKLEAEMLADFGKSPELCLNAVCAINRRQTEKEREDYYVFVRKGRGFSLVDAPRGSEIARFITDNDPWGPIKKTVNELQDHDSSAIDICEKLAKRYSKQLFGIYHSGEDPFFNPSMFGL